jgi:septal ring factor EnvC (AmiA/AmiB activator)
LLEKYTKRNLQLDGLYNSDSLCFVLSKTDRSFDYAQYAKQYPELGDMVSPDIKKAWKLKGDISGLERQHGSLVKSHKKNKKAMTELSANIKNLTSRLKALSSPSTPFASARKRTLSDTEEGN